MGNFSVLLTTEGTYPYFAGGVSTWCHKLITGLREVDYSLISVVDNPRTAQKYNLPDNVKEFLPIPLWGSMDSGEYQLRRLFTEIFLSKINTTDEVIEGEFIPIFSDVVEELICIEKNPEHFGEVLLKMYIYFRKYDYDSTLKSRIVYEYFKAKIIESVDKDGYFFSKDEVVPSIYEIEQSMGLIFRNFNMVNTWVPKTDISHSSAAGICGISNVIAKQLYNNPFLLTEHGVYIREQYLSASRKQLPLFLRNFIISMIESIVRLNYWHADLVCPVCSYNSRWERSFDVSPEKIRVIYNGVEPEFFKPNPSGKNKRSIITIARIDPLKDIENFIYAAKAINEEMPEINFAVYGAVSDEEYYRKCFKLRNSLGLKEKLKFHGHIKNPEEVYREGDIIVLSSISEGFPYSIIEAMMCGKAIVATDVGGVSEALESCGVVVVPGDPIELAKACINLMKFDDLRKDLGIRANQRAKTLFTIEKFTKAYLEVYEQMLHNSNSKCRIENSGDCLYER